MKILVSSIIDLQKSYHNRPHQFVKHLSKKHDITIVSVNDWWKASQNNSTVDQRVFKEMYNRIEYHYITEKKISPFLQELTHKKILSNNKDFDVHLNYNSLITGNSFSKWLPTIFDIADDLISMIRHSPQIPKILRPLGSIIGNYYLKNNISHAKKITLTSPVLRQHLSVPLEKSEIIPNGVDTSFFKYICKAKEILNLNGFIIGYLGVLREWVDFTPIFEVLAKTNNEMQLLIVGGEGQFSEIKNLIKKYDIEKKVLMTGTVNYEKVPLYLSAMDVCLIPFKDSAISQYALPLKLFEYMACEKPVISKKLQSIEQCVGDAILYYQNENDLNNNLQLLFSDSKLRKKLGVLGRAFVADNYDWAIMSQKLEKSLNNLII